MLHSRGFPIERLTENLLIASDLTRNHSELGPLAQTTADVLAAGANAVDRLVGSSDLAEPDHANSDSVPESSREA